MTTCVDIAEAGAWRGDVAGTSKTAARQATKTQTMARVRIEGMTR